MRRIKFSFYKKNWNRLVDQLKDGNNNLRMLLGLRVKLARFRTRRNVELPSSWEGIRERAASLYDALASSWRCRCVFPHCANLLLDDTLEGEDSQYRPQNINFKVWFSFQVETDIGCTELLPWYWHLATVSTIYTEPEPKVSSAPAPIEEIVLGIENEKSSFIQRIGKFKR